MGADTVASALSAIGPLKAELEALSSLVSQFKEEHPLHPKLAHLPTRLKSANQRCKAIHRELSGSRSKIKSGLPAGFTLAEPDIDLVPLTRRNARSCATQTPPYIRHASPRPAVGRLEPREPNFSSPRPSPSSASPRQPSPSFSPRQSSPPPPSSPRASSPLPGGSGAKSPRSASPLPSQAGSRSGSPQRPMLMLSRWPENEVEPRVPMTPREQAIKADNDHPLRVLYRKAPSHFNAEPTQSEQTCQMARLTLSTLRMIGRLPKHFLRLVFLEWVAITVGSEEIRERKIKRAAQRRKEFFSPGGPLHAGCKLHIERSMDHKSSEWNGGKWAGSTHRDAASDPYQHAGRVANQSALLNRSNSSPVLSMARAAQQSEMPLAPGKLHSRLSHMMHMMHTPL